MQTISTVLRHIVYAVIHFHSNVIHFVVKTSQRNYYSYTILTNLTHKTSFMSIKLCTLDYLSNEMYTVYKVNLYKSNMS